MQTRILWRSDTRPFAENFDGFYPREAIDEQFHSRWWLKSIRSRSDADTYPYAYSVEAIQQKCVCMSFNMNSAAMFPLGNAKERKSYLYAIVMPEPMKLAMNCMPITNQSICYPIVNNALDLHSFQTQLAIYNSTNTEIPPDYKMASCQTLSAYECIATHVPASNIVCGVEITQHKPIKETFGFSTLVTSSFTTNGEIVFNPNFRQEQKIVVSDLENKPAIEVIDYSDDVNTITSCIKDAQRQLFFTPKTMYSLGGKTIKNLNFIPEKTDEEDRERYRLLEL
ncbi:hypothetical protein [Legionella sp. 16cNR16C]|uniref:hypothetical protein n=1 Tax=Legionella sp. 16cNR16C TaxID=2905656 RepID=UPI001E43C282|nr:hypothetical protein [Legionella sp. 16cNR16C]MCE3046409.1 hypothetical protein [Legionella sp. 16cNR16C]